MNQYYYVAVPVHHGDGSPKTWVIKVRFRDSSLGPIFLDKAGRFGNKYLTYITREFKTKAEAEFVMQSLPLDGEIPWSE